MVHRIMCITLVSIATACGTTNKTVESFSLIEEINKEIVSEFYNNDTIGKNIYLLDPSISVIWEKEVK